MPLEAGTPLGPYRIEEAVGAGGMGEVYRARDTRLDRDVAIKILPAHLSSSPEVRQRFEREAKTISSLQHAHICSLFDVGKENGTDFLVMEYIEGKNLASILNEGPLSNDDVLKYGIQITEALEAAHKAGVIHRDLKPGNIMITRAGVKLLDFGLAKIAEAGATSDSSLTSLPTVQPGSDSEPLTTQGTILGTYQYMSPEQLEGKESDVRSDIFALGAVLYEMATGRRAFGGDSQASLIASIMSSHPTPISTIHPMTPPVLERVVKTCLEKDPEDRWQTAHGVALQLKWIAEGGSQVGLPAPVAARRHRRERTAWILAAATGVAALGFAALFFLGRSGGTEPNVLRYHVPVPAGIGNSASPRISPDGRYIAYLAADSTGSTQIWVQRMNALDPLPLPGTEDAGRPFWSPDSRHLAYFTGAGKLKKINVSGGPPQTIGEAQGGADGTWGSEGIILFDQSASDSVQSISAGGGIPGPATIIDRSREETGTVWPYFLPDGKHFLFLALGNRPEDTVLKGGTIGSMETKVIGKVDSRFEYVPPGYLLFARDGTLLAQAFDTGAMEFTGEPIPVAEDISSGGVNFQARFSASQNGVLTFWKRGGSGNSSLAWVDREGRELETVGQSRPLGAFALSPDESRLAIEIEDEQADTEDLWIMDLRRNTTSRFTFDPTDDGAPVWSPGGDQIMFGSTRDGTRNIWKKHASGAGSPEKIFGEDAVFFPTDWSSDGKWIITGSFASGTRLDVSALPADGNGELITVAGTEFHEHHGRLSPDGEWIAYSSLESGRWEVYVQAFPEPQGKWQISTAGGSNPTWRDDGKELYYIAPGRVLMAVEVHTDPNLQAGVPQVLFRGNFTESPFDLVRYLPSKSGQKFLMRVSERSADPAPITVVVNWVQELLQP